LSRRSDREMAVRAERIICTGRGRKRQVGETTDDGKLVRVKRGLPQE
jgi:hypothetical protein